MGQTQLGADINGEAADDGSGRSVALSSDGSRVAIGADRNDGTGSDAGHVRVYAWSGSAWVQLGADINGEAAGDNSGYSVALSSDGSRVAIGATDNGAFAGQVRVYSWSGSAWVQLGADINGEAAFDISGNSVALSSDGSRVAIGAEANDGTSGTNSGQVRVYAWSGSAWVKLGADIDGEAAGDQSGWSVALSSDGSRVAIGAIGAVGSGAGQVRVYAWNGSAWLQLGADIDGEAAGDNSGWSVALSSDGSQVAIAAPGNDGTGANAGQVRVYSWSGSAWVNLNADIDGEAAGDNSGFWVALSSDGSRVAIGAPGNDGTGSSAGQVRIYRGVGSTAVLATLVSADALAGRVRLVWYVSGTGGPDARLYRRTVDSDWTFVDRIAADGTGFVRYEDTAVTSGARYGYQLGIIDGGEEVFVGEVWADVPAPNVQLAMRGATPNPSIDGHVRAEFTLHDGSPARLELIDVAGRVVTSKQVGALGAGTHLLDLSEGSAVRPGIYFLRLTQGRSEVRARAMVIE